MRAPSPSPPHTGAPPGPRTWSAEDIALLRAQFGRMSRARLAERLGRDPREISNKAHRMGLTAVRTGCRNRLAHPWTDAEDQAIRREWPDVVRRVPGHTTAALAGRLGVSRAQVQARAAALGVRRPRVKDPPWSEAETELLHRVMHLDVRYQATLFRKAGYSRTPAALAVARRRHGLRVCEATEAYSAQQLARLLGVSMSPVTRWVRCGWLKATPRGDTVAEHGGPGDRWLIEPRHVRQFIVENAALVDLTRADVHWLVDLLANSTK